MTQAIDHYVDGAPFDPYATEKLTPEQEESASR